MESSQHSYKAKPETKEQILATIADIQRGPGLESHNGFQVWWRELPSSLEKQERQIIQEILRKYPDDVARLYHALKKLDSSDVSSPIAVIEAHWDEIHLQFNHSDD